MNNDNIFEHFSEVKEDNYIQNNIKTDYEIKSEEIKEIYMNKNDIANNSTRNITDNDKNQEEEEILDTKLDDSKEDEKNENEIKNNKILGRKKKNVAINNDNKTKRDKFAKDNIARKIKTNFINKFLVNLINIIIKIVFGKQIYLIRKFNKALVTNVSIQFNLDLFNSPIKNLLNQNNSNKYSTVGLNKNKSILRNLENNSEFNEILNITVNKIYSIFINDNYKEIISNIFNIDKKEIYFENITGKIKELKEQEEEEEYIERFKFFAYNINEVFDESKKRKPKNSKSNINLNEN
jgi:hypothetical protein